MNTHVRDNLQETAPGVLSGGVALGYFRINAGGTAVESTGYVKLFSANANDTTANTAYEDYASLTVPVVVDVVSNILLILTIGNIRHSAVDGQCYAIINWDGSDETGAEIRVQPSTPSNALLHRSGSVSILKSAVAAATYTLKARIRIATAGTGTYNDATISAIVVPE